MAIVSSHQEHYFEEILWQVQVSSVSYFTISNPICAWASDDATVIKLIHGRSVSTQIFLLFHVTIATPAMSESFFASLFFYPNLHSVFNVTDREGNRVLDTQSSYIQKVDDWYYLEARNTMGIVALEDYTSINLMGTDSGLLFELFHYYIATISIMQTSIYAMICMVSLLESMCHTCRRSGPRPSGGCAGACRTQRRMGHVGLLPEVELAVAKFLLVVDNRNHPDWNKIAEFLDDVARRMRQEGHDPKKKYALMGADDAVHDEALCGHS
ncbi:Pentatricopeptide repeat-containing protein DOT4, chloroplastic [Zea mays]|uniref:Pentatricopeptide repeat-containing protein DOT4, chloroplastic n=1 Tax=Zea mays TaxID=4577 RepID=A0A3L6E7J3_MAIZE|nr:Pentatricopeptide repeat-containing protein DOT4, chloroplastic [Zea mays]